MDGIARDEKEELRPINLPSPSGVADFPHDVEQPSSPSKDTRHESDDAIPLSFSCIMIAFAALTSIVWVGMLAGQLIGNHFYPDIIIQPPERDEDALVSLLSNSTFTNDTVANLIAPLLVNDTTGDSVGNAVQALQYFKTDGEPVQVNGHPFLFVGSVGEICLIVFTHINLIDHSENSSHSSIIFVRYTARRIFEQEVFRQG